MIDHRWHRPLVSDGFVQSPYAVTAFGRLARILRVTGQVLESISYLSRDVEDEIPVPEGVVVPT